SSARCASSVRPSRCRGRPALSGRRRRTSASTPRRSWTSSGSLRPTSTRFGGTRSSSAMTSAGPYDPEQVAALLESAVATIRAEVEALAKPLHVWHPAEGEWSINEIIGHLIEAERRGFAGRINIPPASKAAQPAGRDENAVARGCPHDG